MMSIPGQTVGVSVFTDYLIDALTLTRSQISLAYLIGTITSALILPFGGRAYDRFGGRKLGIFVMLLLAGTLVIMSFSDAISHMLTFGGLLPYSIVSFIVIAVGFFLLRFFAQGMLSMVNRNMVMEWFNRYRGRANAVLGVVISLMFSLAPQVFDGLIQNTGWRGAWRLMALVIGAVSLLGLLLYRDKPEDFGLIPDGKIVSSRKELHADAASGKDFTLREAQKTYAFWLFIGTITLSGLAVTAFTFHVVDIFGSAGVSREHAVTIFFPASIVAVVLQFGGSWLSDYMQLKWFALIQNIGSALVGVGMLALSGSGSVWVLILGLGFVQGMMGILLNITWARFFGRKHLGAISGFAMSWSVAGSAVGPYIFSLSAEAGDTYDYAAVFCLVVGLILSAGSFFAKRPAHPDPDS